MCLNYTTNVNFKDYMKVEIVLLKKNMSFLTKLNILKS